MNWTNYPCFNPAGQCEAIPDLAKYNAFLGCIDLDTQSSACLPTKCPSFSCGDICPTPCEQDVDDPTCHQTELASGFTHSCSDYFKSTLLRMINRTPVTGCSGLCADGTTTGCCTQATFVQASILPGAPANDIGGSFKFGAAGADATTNPTLAYQNYINDLWYCFTRTCGCPSVPQTAFGTKICSGAGTCEPVIQNSSACAAVTDSVHCNRTINCEWDDAAGICLSLDPGVTWQCSCFPGTTGIACEQQESKTKICPMGWNERTFSLQECGGIHGRCNQSTGACICASGWTGTGCDQTACPSVNGKLCDGNGACGADGRCYCESGFTGSSCNCHTDSTTGKTICDQNTFGNQTPPTGSILGQPSSAPKSNTELIIAVSIGAAVLITVIAAVAGTLLFTKKKLQNMLKNAGDIKQIGTT